MLTESFPFTECCRPVVTVRNRISDLMKIGNCFSKNILEGGGGKLRDGSSPIRDIRTKNCNIHMTAPRFPTDNVRIQDSKQGYK